MSNYNSQLTMEQLFRNNKLSRVLPQFPKRLTLQNVYSGAEIVSRAKKYIAGAIGGRISGESEIVVRGKQSEVLSRVRRLQALVESFFNNIPSVVKNIRSNTSVYTTFVSTGHVEGIKGKEHIDAKIGLLQDILDNFQYNPDFNSMGSIKSMSPRDFSREQAAWFKKVGIDPKTLRR
jgi:hypothetical protein